MPEKHKKVKNFHLKRLENTCSTVFGAVFGVRRRNNRPTPPILNCRKLCTGVPYHLAKTKNFSRRALRSNREKTVFTSCTCKVKHSSERPATDPTGSARARRVQRHFQNQNWPSTLGEISKTKPRHSEKSTKFFRRTPARRSERRPYFFM